MSAEKWWHRYLVDVPEGTSGRWTIERFTVSEDDAAFSEMRSMGRGTRGVPAGTFTRLIAERNSFYGPMMSDTPSEIMDHTYFMRQSKGRLLIHGLGIGMCLKGVLERPEVESVTVVEVDADILTLAAGHYLKQEGWVEPDGFAWELGATVTAGRLTIICGDAMTWKPAKGERWDYVWHDIWPTICGDNLKEMATLHRRFGRRCDWQDSWKRDHLKAQQRREKAENERWRW